MKLSVKINATAEDVYTAITTTAGYQGWWARVCDIDCTPGHISTVKFLKPEVTELMSFKTISTEPLRKLEWLCVENNVFESWIGTTLMFTIVDKGPGVEFQLTQSSPDKEWERSSDYDNTKAGWEFFMDSLKQYCETGIGNPWGVNK